ncbi:SDR family oxidoreductase [Thermoflavifilum aggregans]|uniref:SDR family oxidoreductase n=1 Tax=Thermoflavifilum aggregans TaxID=454188 RepID=UPI0037445319
MNTPMSLRPSEDRAAHDARVAATNPSKRVATTAEIASAALWLASADAAYMVGQDIVIEGELWHDRRQQVSRTENSAVADIVGGERAEEMYHLYMKKCTRRKGTASCCSEQKSCCSHTCKH